MLLLRPTHTRLLLLVLVVLVVMLLRLGLGRPHPRLRSLRTVRGTRVWPAQWVQQQALASCRLTQATTTPLHPARPLHRLRVLELRALKALVLREDLKGERRQDPSQLLLQRQRVGCRATLMLGRKEMAAALHRPGWALCRW